MMHEAFDDEDRRADRDRGVGDVERWPVPARGMEVEEVDHLSITQAVDQVAERATEDQREPAAEEPAARRAHEECTDDADRHEREADEERRLPARRVGEEA